jgi:hypothetical protein
LVFRWFGDILAGSVSLWLVQTVFQLVQFVFYRFGGLTAGFVVFLTRRSCFSTNLMVFEPADECS